MSNQHLDTIKTVIKGAMGAMSFGVYHQFNTNKLMELNNINQDIKRRNEIRELQIKHEKEIADLKSYIDKLLDNKRWW